MLTSLVHPGSKLPGIEQSIFSVMTALAKECNAINLAQGFPDFEVSQELIRLVHSHMQDGHNQYAPMPGLPELRRQIARKTEALYGTSYDPDHEVTVTAGATQAIFTAISAIIKEGDEVIVFEPAYDTYIPSILLNKGAPKYVRLEPPHYRINWDLVKKLISIRTRLIIINSPHNPSGTVMTEEDMAQLAKLVANKDILIISDEVYEHIIFDGRSHQSVCRYPELAARTFVISSFGKTYHTTGWKMGYVLAPKDLTDEFRRVYQYSMFSAFTPVQYAYAELMEENPEYFQELPAFYQKKRDLFLEQVKDSRFKALTCEGTYFACLDYSAISDVPDREFAEKLTRDCGVASIPTSAFYHNKADFHVLRFCFAKKDETLIEAGKRLCKI